MNPIRFGATVQGKEDHFVRLKLNNKELKDPALIPFQFRGETGLYILEDFSITDGKAGPFGLMLPVTTTPRIDAVLKLVEGTKFHLDKRIDLFHKQEIKRKLILSLASKVGLDKTIRSLREYFPQK